MCGRCGNTYHQKTYLKYYYKLDIKKINKPIDKKRDHISASWELALNTSHIPALDGINNPLPQIAASIYYFTSTKKVL